MTVRMRHHAGEFVDAGIYWNTKTWRFTGIPEGRNLPGEKGVTYFGVPRFVPLLAGPLLGLFYILVLPCAGLVYLVYYGMRRVFLAAMPMRRRGAHRGAGGHH
jgi:hypothetical protein